MSYEYREFNIAARDDQAVVPKGWELVGLHRKMRRTRPVVVAIMRRPRAAQPEPLLAAAAKPAA